MITPWSSIFLVSISAVLGSIASVLLKAGANHLHRQKESLKVALPRLFVGGVIFVIGSLFYLWGIRDGSLTVLYPMLALGYVWTLVWSRLFFGEPINRPKVYGVAMVLAGVTLIALGNQ